MEGRSGGWVDGEMSGGENPPCRQLTSLAPRASAALPVRLLKGQTTSDCQPAPLCATGSISSSSVGCFHGLLPGVSSVLPLGSLTV